MPAPNVTEAGINYRGPALAAPIDQDQYVSRVDHTFSPRDTLFEMRRVLRPGGVLVGSVPARSMIWKLRFLSSTCPHSEPFHNEYLPAEVRTMLAGWNPDQTWWLTDILDTTAPQPEMWRNRDNRGGPPHFAWREAR